MKKISDLINKDVVDITLAKQLGKVINVNVNADKITELCIDQGYIPIDKVINVGEVITVNTTNIIADTIGQPLPLFGAKVINEKGKHLGRVKDYEYTDSYTLRYINLEEKRISAKQASSMSSEYLVCSKPVKKTVTPSIPTIVADYSFLIGRRLSRNILTKEKKLLLAEGTIITKEHVDKAKNHSKLVDLTLYSSPIK